MSEGKSAAERTTVSTEHNAPGQSWLPRKGSGPCVPHPTRLPYHRLAPVTSFSLGPLVRTPSPAAEIGQDFLIKHAAANARLSKFKACLGKGG